jgi:hypothetical protein
VQLPQKLAPVHEFSIAQICASSVSSVEKAENTPRPVKAVDDVPARRVLRSFSCQDLRRGIRFVMKCAITYCPLLELQPGSPGLLARAVPVQMRRTDRGERMQHKFD